MHHWTVLSDSATVHANILIQVLKSYSLVI